MITLKTFVEIIDDMLCDSPKFEHGSLCFNFFLCIASNYLAGCPDLEPSIGI